MSNLIFNIIVSSFSIVNTILLVFILIKNFRSKTDIKDHSCNHNGYEYIINKLKKEKNRLLEKYKNLACTIEVLNNPELKRSNIRLELENIDDEIICSISKTYELICFIENYFEKIRTSNNERLPIEIETVLKNILEKIRTNIL